MLRVTIIDYGLCNLGSVRRAFEECGADAVVTDDPRALKSTSHAVLPGVGAYRDAMDNIRKMGWDEAIYETVVKERIPLLGICLGMQILSQTGHEGGFAQGLGLIPGEVKRLAPGNPWERIPHVGWNEVRFSEREELFNGIADGTDFYFVHSFHFQATDVAHVIARTPYGGGFASVVRSGHVMGTQFHPEKSSVAGFRLIRNFLELRS